MNIEEVIGCQKEKNVLFVTSFIRDTIQTTLIVLFFEEDVNKNILIFAPIVKSDVKDTLSRISEMDARRAIRSKTVWRLGLS